MINFLYLFTTLFTLLVSYFLFSRVSGSMAITRINMVSFIFYFYLIIQTLIGSYLILIGVGSNAVLKSIANDDTRIIGWFWVQYTMFFVPIGMLIAKKIFFIKSMNRLFNNYTIHNKIEPLYGQRDNTIKMALILLTIFSVSSVVYVLIKTGSIPILKIFELGSQSAILEYRVGFHRGGYGGSAIIKNVFATGLTIILSYIYYIYWINERKIRYLVLFITTFICSFFILTVELAKTPFVLYLFSYIFLIVLVDGKIKKKTLVINFLITFTILILIYFYLEKHTSLFKLFSSTSLLGRIIISQVSTYFLMFELFPLHYDYLYFSPIFSSVYKLFGLLPIESASRIAMIHVFPEQVALGRANYLSTIFLGEAWANFGIFGLILSPIYVGFIIQTFYIFILKSKKTPIMISLLVYCSYNSNFTSALSPYIFNYRLWLIFFVIFVSIAFARELYIKHKRITTMINNKHF